MICRRFTLIGAILLGSILALGCAPKIISPNTGVYHQGILYANSSMDVTAVYEAALSAISKFEFKVIKQAKDLFYAEILSKSAAGRNITVRIQKKGDTRTDYIIVHESFNKEISTAIFEHMQKRLKQ